MKNHENDPGLQTIGKIYRDFQINTKWSQVIDRGFIWWGGQFAQTIWAEPPFKEDGLHISKVHGEIEFIQYSEISESDQDILADSMTLATMSGPIINPETHTISLYSSGYVHEENHFWLVPLLEQAFLVQNYDAMSKANSIADIFEWKPALSGHPNSGPRTEMDDMLNLIDRVVIPMGQKPIKSLAGELFHNMASYLSSSGLVTTADDNGLTSSIPFGDETALFRATTSEKHPALGNGLLITITLPPEEISQTWCINGGLMMELNKAGKDESLAGHSLGSWCLAEGRGAHAVTPAFVTFIPAYGCNANVFTNMVYSTLKHARFARNVFFYHNR
jgi:hypothetical protein